MTYSINIKMLGGESFTKWLMGHYKCEGHIGAWAWVCKSAVYRGTWVWGYKKCDWKDTKVWAWGHEGTKAWTCMWKGVSMRAQGHEHVCARVWAWGYKDTKAWVQRQGCKFLGMKAQGCKHKWSELFEFFALRCGGAQKYNFCTISHSCTCALTPLHLFPYTHGPHACTLAHWLHGGN